MVCTYTHSAYFKQTSFFFLFLSNTLINWYLNSLDRPSTYFFESYVLWNVVHSSEFIAFDFFLCDGNGSCKMLACNQDYYCLGSALPTSFIYSYSRDVYDNFCTLLHHFTSLFEYLAKSAQYNRTVLTASNLKLFSIS